VTLRFLTLIFLCSLIGRAEAPLRVDLPVPPLLDLTQEDPARLLPSDDRNPAALEAISSAWKARLASLGKVASVRVRLPRQDYRLPLLLAASQALKAREATVRIYLDFDGGAPALWNESAWGAVDGGALLPSDLGTDPTRWRTVLARAQELFPGRPWTLWLPADPGASAGSLMGDGAHLVVPAGGPAATLAAMLPADLEEVEGGPGDLTLRGPGKAKRWRFQGGAWSPADLPPERNEVAVTDQAAYDVGALLARMRAAQLRDRATVKNLEARVEVDLHLQGRQGTGADLGFTFRAFEKTGEPEELLQRQVRFNGVKANLQGEVQLPIIESRTSIAAPVALALTERYRYRDGGPAPQAGQRLLRFEPVGDEAGLFLGELRVDESTGRIHEEHSQRNDLPGTVKSEDRTLRYGEAAPGVWRVVDITTFERWVGTGGVGPVQRRIRYFDWLVNGPDFDSRRSEARASVATMLRQTPEGLRYFTRQADGSRKLEEKPRTSGRAIGGFLFMDPNLSPPVLPAAGLAYFDFNAFDRGVQVSALTALVFNTASVAVPRIFGGFDFRGRAMALLLPSTERPVKMGQLLDRDGVGRRFANLSLALGRDLGMGFRMEFEGGAQYDRFSLAREEKYRTPDFKLPESGITRWLVTEGSWQAGGFQLRSQYGWGRRPSGDYGTPAHPQRIPEDGALRRWGGSVGYDRQMDAGWWIHGEGGVFSGRGFDRFDALDVGGLGGTVRVAGIRSGAVAADHLTYAKAGVVLPSGPGLRLSFTFDHARVRSLDDQQQYGLSGLGIAGDLPGFWWFTTLRVDLGVGLKSDIPGLRTVNGWIALLRVF
jgi:hypothetical protein